ncbi:unnamed protein product [Enterobius vermicularis]|uniref:RGS domain-containing protein n=1 Tax=Enterobius vermicularis TaxID=51028 RepID=A0A0N4VLU0_ENTVE|nr:unnamed protein product [Enterobius vermicularis]
MATAMFDLNMGINREPPQVPSTDNVDYPRAASWANANLHEVLKDEKGRQLLLVFLHSSLAEENLYFVESVKQVMDEKDPLKKKDYFEEFYQKYSPCVNISSAATQAIREGAQQPDPDMQAAFGLAYREVNGLLERDQFPRFKRSEVYLSYLEKLLPRAYAEKWANSFEALLGNQIGRYYFRKYLKSIRAEENLRFWEAVIEFRQTKNNSSAMLSMAKNIQRQYLVEGTSHEVFLAFGIRQLIEKRIKDDDIDASLFDDAIKHVEKVLKTEPYHRFINSEEYKNLLHKLK